MDELNVVLGWLGGCPFLKDVPLAVDTTDEKTGSCGLFPQGTVLISRAEDVLGNARCRYRQTYLLRRLAAKGEKAAGWLMELESWVRSQTPPPVGRDTAVRAEKGRLVKAEATGTATFEIMIIIEFEEDEYV